MAKRPVPKYDFKAFGAAIKAAREGRKESRKKVGDEMFISPRYLANIENKGQHPSLQIFFELIQRYHISVDQFLLETPPEKNTQRRHQSGRSWHFDRIHGQSYFLPADRTGAATGEEAVFWAVHPVQPDLPCAPAGRVVFALLSVADDLWFFYKAKKGSSVTDEGPGRVPLAFIV